MGFLHTYRVHDDLCNFYYWMFHGTEEMTDYPLTEALGVKIQSPASSCGVTLSFVLIDDLERALEKAPVVYGFGKSGEMRAAWTESPLKSHELTGLVVCVQEIKKETAEDLLRELLSKSNSVTVPLAWLDRARRLLSGG